MEFLTNYGLFLAKCLTIIIAIFIILFGMILISQYAKTKIIGKLSVKKINDRYKEYKHILYHAMHKKNDLKHILKKELQKNKVQKKKDKVKPRSRIFVLNFQGDMRASAVSALREEITAILTLAHEQDKVLIRLDSAGGLVNAYGLAASQLQRIRDANIHLTIAVDKIAASGGYMMACVGNEIISAPFAIIGSIGVLAQIPNLHRFLQKKCIDFEQVTAGPYKRTLTVFGKNTQKARDKMQEEIDETHLLFKEYIKAHRPDINIDQVATGEHWYGQQAINLKLVDKIKTSDDYLLANSKTHDIYEIEYKIKKSFGKRVSEKVSQNVYKILELLRD